MGSLTIDLDVVNSDYYGVWECSLEKRNNLGTHGLFWGFSLEYSKRNSLHIISSTMENYTILKTKMIDYV